MKDAPDGSFLVRDATTGGDNYCTLTLRFVLSQVSHIRNLRVICRGFVCYFYASDCDVHVQDGWCEQAHQDLPSERALWLRKREDF